MAGVERDGERERVKGSSLAGGRGMRIEKGDIRKQEKEKMKFGFQEGDSKSNGEEKKGKGGGDKEWTENWDRRVKKWYEEDNEQEGKKGNAMMERGEEK